MIVITGHIRVTPEDLEKLRAPMNNVIEATRQEKGCLLYAYGEDVLDAGVIRIVERWESWEALDAHGGAPHVDTWRQALADVGVVEREILAHQTGEEKAL